MTGRIPAIETRVYGCRFRSRTEARFAVFFTGAGMQWEYEPEGMELEAGRYLPDFRVTANGVSVWVEVKPPVDDHDDPRWTELAARSGMMLFTVRGLHRPGDRCGLDHSARVFHPDGTVADVYRLWQAEKYQEAWVKANTARFDGTDEPGFFGTGKRRAGRKGRRR